MAAHFYGDDFELAEEGSTVSDLSPPARPPILPQRVRFSMEETIGQSFQGTPTCLHAHVERRRLHSEHERVERRETAANHAKRV